jgi:hypothetical protein
MAEGTVGAPTCFFIEQIVIIQLQTEFYFTARHFVYWRKKKIRKKSLKTDTYTL